MTTNEPVELPRATQVRLDLADIHEQLAALDLRGLTINELTAVSNALYEIGDLARERCARTVLAAAARESSAARAGAADLGIEVA